MRFANRCKTRNVTVAFLLGAIVSIPVFAQAGPPSWRPEELDRLVSRVALYPDPLLAQALTAATYYDQIPDAARWANEHSYLRGDQLARAIEDDRVPWDPSVQALLPFPSVLDMMARDPGWTRDLGDAFLAQHDDVMDAVQRMRWRARQYGYLRSTREEAVVDAGPRIIEIRPVAAGYYSVPVYDPAVVFAPPRRGFAVAAAISFGPSVVIGAAFGPWGWGASRFVWSSHTVIINNRPWARTWVNRREYAHSYNVPRYQPARRVERHDIKEHEERGREKGRNRHDKKDERRPPH